PCRPDSVVDDPPGYVTLTAAAGVVFVGVVAPAGRVALEAAGKLPTCVPEIVAGVSTRAFVSEGDVAEYASGVSARLTAPDLELTNVGGARRPRARHPRRGGRGATPARAQSRQHDNTDE